MDYIFDTHAHYDDEAFDADREEVLTGLKEQGIGTVVNVGASIASTKTTLALAETHSFMYAAVGVHPNETAELTDADMKWLESLAENPKVVAIGEIGLDYYWDEPEREIQKHWFSAQLEVTKKTGLPVIIHSRRRRYYEGGTQRCHRRRDPLLFLRSGDGERIPEYGILYRDRRSTDLQEREKID